MTDRISQVAMLFGQTVSCTPPNGATSLDRIPELIGPRTATPVVEYDAPIRDARRAGRRPEKFRSPKTTPLLGTSCWVIEHHVPYESSVPHRTSAWATNGLT